MKQQNYLRTIFGHALAKYDIRYICYAEKWSPGKMVPGKMVPEKNGPRKKWSPEKWSPENWSSEKCPSKIVLHQKNARKFKRLFRFYQLIPLHTQKNV